MSSREQIVIIDDDPNIRDLMTAIFIGEGYSCRAFASAREALDQLDEIVPIAVFVDICMPDMDGMAFMHELRKSHASLPVVVMTGYANQDIFRQSLQYRIADLLAKPFRANLVRESLRKVLGRDASFSDQFLETVTHRLREARLALGLKQAEVAARCGLSTSQVSQIELRQSSPSVTTLLRLCKALNLTMTELVQGF
jgi:DNA-binding NtrC family response regulator